MLPGAAVIVPRLQKQQPGVFRGVLPNNSTARPCGKDHVSLNQRSEVSQRFNLIRSKIRAEPL